MSAAAAFAAKWIAAWNARDLEHVLSHYAEDVVFVSPRAAELTGDPIVRGKPALRSYWTKALALAPDLHFTLETVFEGAAGRLTLVYARADGRRGAESFVLGEDGLVVESMACYAG